MNLPRTISILLSILLVFAVSCSDQPASIDDGTGGGDLSGTGEIDPRTGEAFLLGTVSDNSFSSGYIEVWADSVSFDPDDGIVSFDIRLVNRTRTNFYPPIFFVITSIVPEDIAVLEIDGVTGDGLPYYDFSPKLGEDNILEAGGSTEPVTMKFHTVESRSFAIGFRIDIGPPAGTGMIAGTVYADENQNGSRDAGEHGIPRIPVSLERSLSDGDRVVLLSTTDREGNYHFCCFPGGVYKVSVNPSYEANWKVTSTNPLLVTLVEGPGGVVQNFLDADFGLFPIYPPDPEELFGPVIVGPFSSVGTVLDTTFVNPPCNLTVVLHYYLEISEPPFLHPHPMEVESAVVWINDQVVFEYHRDEPADSVLGIPKTIEIRGDYFREGENKIRILTEGNEYTALMWRLFRKP
jgi:hypothetical protein